MGEGLDPSADIFEVYVDIGEPDLVALECIMAAFGEERSTVVSGQGGCAAYVQISRPTI